MEKPYNQIKLSHNLTYNSSIEKFESDYKFMKKPIDKNRKLLADILAIKQSELSSFFDSRKFINSMLAHQIAVSAAYHYKNHKDSSYMNQFLSLFPFGSTEYLKTLRWFEYRTRISLVIIDKKIKKNPENTLKDENYQIIGEFIKQYNGPLPEVKFTAKSQEKIAITPDDKKKQSKFGRDPRDEHDLIDQTPMRIGGQIILGGYGTGKRR